MSRKRVNMIRDVSDEYYVTAYSTNNTIAYQTAGMSSDGTLYYDFVNTMQAGIVANVWWTIGTMSEKFRQLVPNSVFGRHNDGMYGAIGRINNREFQLAFKNDGSVLGVFHEDVAAGANCLVEAVFPVLGGVIADILDFSYQTQERMVA